MLKYVTIKEICIMLYRVYCIQKLGSEKKERVVRVNVFAECIAEALNKAKELFGKKLKKNSFNIFMYESQN